MKISQNVLHYSKPKLGDRLFLTKVKLNIKILKETFRRFYFTYGIYSHNVTGASVVLLYPSICSVIPRKLITAHTFTKYTTKCNPGCL